LGAPYPNRAMLTDGDGDCVQCRGNGWFWSANVAQAGNGLELSQKNQR